MADKEKSEIELTEITTDTAQAFKLPNGDIVNANELLVWMANQIQDIHKSVS